MQIKDLIVLGRACPEPLKDGRVTVCLAGWSASEGFIRIYPTRYDTPCHQWDVIDIEVEKNEQDTRFESRKIVGSKTEWETLSSKIKIVGSVDKPAERANLLYNLKDRGVNYINNVKRSLGIIRPQIKQHYFRQNLKYSELFQMGLPGFTELDQVKVKRDFPYEPRVKYTCPDDPEDTTPHDQQILEWGFYEWIRKNPDNKEQVWENAQFNRADTDLYFLVGNQMAHRTSFMVISVLRVPTGYYTVSMFPLKRLSTD
jgi:hypothetical protein